MAAYEILLLNTAIPQIQAAQSGDTYVVPRDIAINATAIISANSATDALRITQTGSGNALVVEDEANPDATPFVVTAAGNVGIGTSSPVNKLDVQAGFISTYDPTNANGAGYSVRFYTDANAGSRAEVARIGGIQEGAGNNGRIVFATSTSGSVTEKMTLSSDGTFRVKGLGTAGSTDAVQFSGSAPAQSLILNSSGNLLVGTTTNNDATLAVSTTTNSRKLTKTFSANFTTNPQTRNVSLTINNAIAVSVEITIIGIYANNDYSGTMKQAYGFLSNDTNTSLYGSANTNMYSLGNTSSAYAFGAATKPNNTTVNLPITYTGADTNTRLSVVVEIYGDANAITAISFS